MEIRNNSVGAGGSDRIDFTKANREAIREQSIPATPVKPLIPPEDQTRQTRERVQNHREGMIDRVQNARSRYLDELAFHKRVKNAREGMAAGGAVDAIEVSDSARELADTTLTPRPSDVDASERAKRVSELRTQFASGKLDVENLVAETAYRMLGGE